MSEIAKILGQVAPAATTETEIFTVPANTWEMFWIHYCERGGNAATFRVSMSLAGGATSTKDYIRFNYACSAYGADKIGPLTAQGNVEVNIYASTADMSFTACTAEITSST